nr:ATP-binding protein [bacterium]
MLIYGANASGKTNILKAIDFIKYVALSSFQ